jgi:hypothetical protein
MADLLLTSTKATFLALIRRMLEISPPQGAKNLATWASVIPSSRPRTTTERPEGLGRGAAGREKAEKLLVPGGFEVVVAGVVDGSWMISSSSSISSSAQRLVIFTDGK